MALMHIVKGYFAAIGIDMDIRPMETAAWQSFVQINHQHDQLAHRPAGPLGKTSAPLMDLNRFQTGAFVNYQMISDPVFDALCSKAMAAANIDEVKQIFRDANEYVARQHFAVSLLQPMSYSLCQPWVKGFNAQFGSSWGAAGGPGMLSFYLGRFWINHELKKSMGH
jgi:ABC-type transport system substrate-binding protein